MAATSDPIARSTAAVSNREVALLIALGIAIRVAWMILVHALTTPVDLGEATNATIAFARRGTIADAYFPGQGPTAHFLPTMIVIGGSVERLFGIDSPAATLALAIWALAQVSVGFVLTVALFRKIGASRATQLFGLAVLCILPACIAQEAADFRLWEGALAYDLAAANLLWMAVLSDRAGVSTRDLAIAAIGSAIAFFVDPPAGLAVCAAWGVFVLRLPIGQIARWALLTAIAIAALVAPWAMRNQALLGEPVLLRSNFGLQLAIAYHDGALDPASPGAEVAARMKALAQTRPRLAAAGGELAYSRAIGATAIRWMVAHPVDAARLSLRHYRQFYVPDTWQEGMTNWDTLERFRIVALQIVGMVGLIGLAVGLARRRRHYGLLAAYIAVVGLPYIVTQPIPRYGYLVYPLLVLLAARLIVELWTAISIKPWRAPPRPLPA